MVLETSCSQAWPGLCCTRDSRVWRELTLAANVLTNTMFDLPSEADHIGKFCRLRGLWQDEQRREGLSGLCARMCSCISEGM